MAKQLLGKEVTAALNERIKGNVAALQEKGVNPTLCIIRVGENPSDISYEKGATKRCETLGVACEKILLPEDVAQEELLTVIDKVNKDDHIHGVLLFRPLPKHLDQAVIENALAPEKDVDCMTDLSMSGVFTSVAREADIIIVAAGRAGVVGADYEKAGQVVIDVGINVNAEGKLCGDVDYAAVEPIVDAITPVPGGVGSVTTSVLVGHVVEAAMRKVNA